MSDDDPDVTQAAQDAQDALAVAQRALSKVNDLEDQVDELRADRQELVEDLTALQLRLSEIDEERPYESLTLDEKVGMVREHGYQKATTGHGRAKLDYDDVMWEVFDGKPGTKHCYKLIRLAAGLEEEDGTGGTIPGFKARDPTNGNYHLAIDAEDAKRGQAFFPRTKNEAEGVR